LGSIYVNGRKVTEDRTIDPEDVLDVLKEQGLNFDHQTIDCDTD